jgi:hypothetical protein
MRLIPASDFSISEIIVPAYQAKIAELTGVKERKVKEYTKIYREAQLIEKHLKTTLEKVKEIEGKLGLARQKQADAKDEIDKVCAKLKQQQEELDMMTGVASLNKRPAENEIDPPAKKSRTVESESAASSSADQGASPMVVDSAPSKETTSKDFSDEDAAHILSGFASSATSSQVSSSPTNAQKKAQEKATQKKLQAHNNMLQTFFKPGTRVYSLNREGLIESFNPVNQTFSVVFGSHVEVKLKSELLYVPKVGDQVLMKATQKEDSQQRYYKATVLEIIETRRASVVVRILWNEYQKEETRDCRAFDTILPFSDDSQLSGFKCKLVTDSGLTGMGYYI